MVKKLKNKFSPFFKECDIIATMIFNIIFCYVWLYVSKKFFKGDFIMKIGIFEFTNETLTILLPLIVCFITAIISNWKTCNDVIKKILELDNQKKESQNTIIERQKSNKEMILEKVKAYSNTIYNKEVEIKTDTNYLVKNITIQNKHLEDLKNTTSKDILPYQQLIFEIEKLYKINNSLVKEIEELKKSQIIQERQELDDNLEI